MTSVALSGDGKRVAAACRSEIVLVDVEGAAPPRRLPTASDLITHVEFSPDGKLLAAAGGTPGQYGEVRFVDPMDGRLISSRRSGKDTLFRGNFAPDGKAIALGGADGAVHVVPVDPKQPIRRFEPAQRLGARRRLHARRQDARHRRPRQDNQARQCPDRRASGARSTTRRS